MIESPVKPPPLGGPPHAPPPDPRTRVPESAPDSAARHEFACRYCGAPLHADQAACLSCGAMVETADDRIGLRRAVTGSAAILLLLGGAVGAAVAGLPNGKHVGKGPIAQVFGKKPATIPPATVTPSPRSGSKGVTTPLPTSKTPSKPPPIHKSSTSPSTKSGSSGSSSSGSSGGSQSSGSSSGRKHKKKPKTHKHKPSGLTLFTSAEEPERAGLFAGDHAGSVSNVWDANASTWWTATKRGAGVWVQAKNPPYRKLALISPTPGYTVKLYYYSGPADKNPPSDLNSWKHVDSKATRPVGKRRKVRLPAKAQNANYYLVLMESLPPGGRVKLAEIQFLP